MRSWGRRVLLATAGAMAVVPWLADWNRRHTFGPGYGPHARWHGTAEVVASTSEAALMWWLLSRPSAHDRWLRTCVAALLPILRYSPFNITLAVKGTSPYEQGKPPSNILGLPTAVVAQNSIIVAALAGWWLEHRFLTTRRHVDPHRRGRINEADVPDSDRGIPRDPAPIASRRGYR